MRIVSNRCYSTSVHIYEHLKGKIVARTYESLRPFKHGHRVTEHCDMGPLLSHFTVSSNGYGLVPVQEMDQMWMKQFFDPKGQSLDLTSWCDLYGSYYFLNAPKRGRKINSRNQTSPFVESEAIRILNQTQLLNYENLKFIFGWKLGQINHRASEQEQQVSYRLDWSQHLIGGNEVEAQSWRALLPIASCQVRELLCGECDSRCGSLTGHWWNFLEFQTSYEHGHRRYSAPAVQFPTGTDEFRVWAQGEVQDQLSDATVKLLWQLEERLLRPGLPVSRAPY